MNFKFIPPPNTQQGRFSASLGPPGIVPLPAGPGERVYDTPGDYYFAWPYGVPAVRVECWGGGGGGGAAIGAAPGAIGGGGGGGGGYAAATILFGADGPDGPADPNVTVGAGGPGWVHGGATPTQGQQSQWYSNVDGGGTNGGGGHHGGVGDDGDGGFGGSGGTATQDPSDYAVDVELIAGETPDDASVVGGAGTAGGNSPEGGAGGAGGTVHTNGHAGGAAGGGGGGAGADTTGPGFNGGAGGNGRVRIFWPPT